MSCAASLVVKHAVRATTSALRQRLLAGAGQLARRCELARRDEVSENQLTRRLARERLGQREQRVDRVELDRSGED